MNNIVEIVKADSVSSENRWDAAVEGARRDGDHNAVQSWETSAERCAAHYAAAIEALKAGDLAAAEAELESANLLESSGGDNADAHHALKAVRAAMAAA